MTMPEAEANYSRRETKPRCERRMVGSSSARMRRTPGGELLPRFRRLHRLRKMGFIEYNGEMRAHSSLLNVVLHD
jgi:hypothetical protein